MELFKFTDEPTTEESQFTDEPFEAGIRFTDEPTETKPFELDPYRFEGDEPPAPSLTWDRLVGASQEGSKDIVRSAYTGLGAFIKYHGMKTREEIESGEYYKSHPWYSWNRTDEIDKERLQSAKSIEEFGQAYLDFAAKEKFKADPEYFQTSGFLEDLVRQGPQFITQMLVSAASMPVGTIFMGAQILGGTINSLMAEGVTDRDILMRTALLNTIIQTPLEQLGISKGLKFWKAKGAIVKRLKALTAVVGAEMATEYTQSYSDMFTEVLAKNPDADKLAAYDHWLRDISRAHKEGIHSALVVAPWALIGHGAANVTKQRKWKSDLRNLGLTEENIVELQANPTLSPQDFLASREAEPGLKPTEVITAEDQFAGLEEEQLKTQVDESLTPEQMNSGMTSDEAITLEERIRSDEEKAQAEATAAEARKQELARQKEAEAASAQIQEEAQARADAEVKAESALNAQRQFETDISFRSGLVRTAGVAIPVMEQSGTPEVKRAVKPIRSAQKAIAVPQDNATKILEIQNDLRISMSEQRDPRIGAMMQRLDDELEVEVKRIDAKERAEEQALRLRQAQAEAAKEAAKVRPVAEVARRAAAPRKPAVTPAAPKPKVPVGKPAEYKARVPEAAAKAKAAKAERLAKTKAALEVSKAMAAEKKARVTEAKEKIAAEKKIHPVKYSREQLKSVGFKAVAFKHPKTGKIYKGKPGDLHATILDDNFSRKEISELYAFTDNLNSRYMGYVDAKNKFYNRQQAHKIIGGLAESIKMRKAGMLEYQISEAMREKGQLKYSRAELDLKAQETRKKMARGALQEQTEAFDKAMQAAPRLQPHTIRHTQRFFVGKQKIYGPKKAGDIGKQVAKRHPIIGLVRYTEYHDKKGNLVLDTPILPVDKKARDKMMDRLIQKHRRHADWYVEWGEFLDKLNAARMSSNEIAKRVKILGVLSAGRSPRSNQMHYAHVLTQLERGEEVKGGAGTKISAAEATKITDIWEGKDKDVKTLEDRIKKFGAKVGSFIHVGLQPYDPKGVVVDRHVARLWGFDVTRTQKKDPVQGYHGAFNVTNAMKSMIDKDTIAAGNRNNMSPSQAQAALWFAARPDLAQVGSYREAAQIKPSKYISEQEFVSTTEDRVQIIHYREDVKKAIKPSVLLGRAHGYSKEVQNRKDARTPMTDYIGFSDWYAAGTRPEMQLVGKKPHVTEVPSRTIYNLAEDKLGFWKAARERIENDSDAFPGNDSYTINAVAYLIRETGDYIGFSTGRATGKWFHLFQPARVEPPVKVTIMLSDAVQGVVQLPDTIIEIDKLLDTVIPKLEKDLKDSLKENNYPIKVISATPTIAKFPNATGGEVEYGINMTVEGPMAAVRAYASEAVGLNKAQRMVFVTNPDAKPNGTRIEFMIKPMPLENVQASLKKAGVHHTFNLTKFGDNVYGVDMFFSDSAMAAAKKSMKKFVKLFDDIGASGTLKDYRTHSEILGDFDNDLTKSSQDYMKHITKFFGEDKGREITEKATDKGTAYSGLAELRGGYVLGSIASEERIRKGRAAPTRTDLRSVKPEREPTQEKLFPVEKPKYARDYVADKKARLAEAGQPKEVRAAAEYNRLTNYEHALQSEGKWPDFPIYQFTPQAGPAIGATFVMKAGELNVDAIKQKMSTLVREFSKKPKYDRPASQITDVSRIGSTTMGAIQSDIMNRRDTSSKLKVIYLKHGRNTTQDWMSPVKIAARIMRNLSATGVSYKEARAIVSPMMKRYEDTYKKVVGPKYLKVEEKKAEALRDKEEIKRIIEEFKRRKAAAPSKSELQEAVTKGLKNANAAMAGRIKFQVLDKSRDLANVSPELYDQMDAENVHGTVNGVFDPNNQTFYIFTENVKSVLAAKRVAWHELGHLSLAEILGKKTVDPLMRQIEAKYSDEVDRRIDLFGYADTQENRAREAEEVLINMFVADKQVGIIQRVKDMLRQLAYRFGFKPNEITDTDIANLVKAMRDNILKNKKPLGNANSITRKLPKFTRSETPGSEAFNKWLKGSKVVRDGDPIVMYHGTSEQFALTDMLPSESASALLGEGFYFTEDPKYASFYAQFKAPTGSLIPTYLNIKNPFIATMKTVRSGDTNFDFLKTHASEASALLKAKGYDGTLIKDERTGMIMEAIVYDKDQIRSIFEIEAPQAMPKYSRSAPERKSVAHIGINAEQSVREDPMDLELSWTDLAMQQTVDSLRSLKVLETKEGKDLKALSGYKSFNLLSNFPTMFSSFLRYGRVKFADNWVKVEVEQDGGLFTVWNRLGNTAESFFERLTAKSAQEMLNKGRKNLFGKGPDGEMLNDQQEIDSIKAATVIEYRQNRDLWDWAENRLKELNKSVLDFAEQSQIINAEQRQQFERDTYIPFFRLIGDEMTGEIETLFPSATGKMAPGKIHRLEGSVKNIGDPLMNLVNSYSFIMRSGLTNLARVKSLTSAKNMGLLTATPDSKGPRTIGIRIKGEEKYFNVSDQAVYNSLIEMDSMTSGLFSGIMNKLFKLFIRGPKKLLTFGVTVNPAFRVANFIRDTIHTAFMERTFGNVFASMHSFVQSYKKTPEFIEFMSMGGAFSGSYHQRDTLRPTFKDIRKERKKIARELRPVWHPAKWWEIYERIGEASENANRFRLYKLKKKRGATAFEAAYDAKDLLDFHRSGQNQLLQFFTQSVPFLNARIQGMYKLGRAATSRENAANFWIAASALTFASLMLHMHNDDDERYQKLTDSDRILYWHFFDVPGIGHLRIPTPFEVGSFFGALPAALYETMKGTRTTKELGQFSKQIVQDVLRVDVPQWIKPFQAQAQNQNLFTKAPIVPLHLERVEAKYQVKPRTTKAAKLIGVGMEKIGAPEKLQSPARIDAFITDIAAFLGYFTLETTDQLLEWFNAFPDDPAVPTPRKSETYVALMLGYGRFVRGEEPPRFTKHQRAFYDYKREYDKILATYNLLRKNRMKGERRKYRKEHKSEIKMARQLESQGRRIQTINAKINLIIVNQNLSSKQKAIKIDEQLTKRQKVFEKLVKKVRSKMEE